MKNQKPKENKKISRKELSGIKRREFLKKSILASGFVLPMMQTYSAPSLSRGGPTGPMMMGMMSGVMRTWGR